MKITESQFKKRNDKKYNLVGNCVYGLDDPYFRRNVCSDATEMAGIVDEDANEFLLSDEFIQSVNWPHDLMGLPSDNIYEFAYNPYKDIYWAYNIEDDVHFFFVRDSINENYKDTITVKTIKLSDILEDMLSESQLNKVLIEQGEETSDQTCSKSKSSYPDLNENIYRLRELMGLLTEQDENRIAVLIDGTSSAGKSKTSQMLNAVPFYEATDKNQWVQIDSDMFGCEKDYCIENRIKYDHAGDGPNPDAGEQFHREMADKRKNHDYGSKRGQTTVGFHLHPHNKDLIQGVDSRNWYMAQEYKYGGWKKVIFDDIDKGIKRYIPEVKHILLHAPIYILLQNVAGRPIADSRDPKEVLGQYLEKYVATKNKPSENAGDPSTVLTKGGLEDLLSKSIPDKNFIDSFIKQLGIIDDGQYYIAVKNDYLTPDTQLINVDSERTVYLNKFKDVIQNT